MENYWDGRYRKEGKIWGDAPSVTAQYACRIFCSSKAKNLLIPGIGYGRNARVFTDSGFKVDGIEISEEAAAILKEDLPSVKCVIGSVTDMRPEKERYDAIYCFNVLHLLRGDERVVFLSRCFDSLREGGLGFFTVFSEKEASFGRGNNVEPNTFESKPGRPVHYYTDEDLRSQFSSFVILETGLVEDPEDHGDEGPHVHALRFVLAQKRPDGFDGERYKKVSGHQKEWGDRVIAGLSLRGDERVLDLGCGDGVLSEKLASIVPNGSVLGIDSSESMISTAKKLERSNLKFRQMDINALDFKDEFNVIFSNAALHWIKDHKLLLKNASVCLEKFGIVRFSFAGDGNCSNFIAVVKEVIADPGYSKYFTYFEWPWYMPTASEYEKLVSSNFNDVSVWVENTDRHFTKEELIGWIDQPSILPFLRYINGPDRSRFRDKVVRRMLERTGQEDGMYFETFRRINVRAVKKP
jgi:trans-aconitate methyltransferase